MKRYSGFSILELIISMSIFSLILTGIVVLQVTIFRNNKTSGSRANIDQRSISILRSFSSEVRTAQTPYDGSFPIATSTDDTLSFYTDITGDGVIERVRYFVEDETLKRGIVIPDGQPLTYSSANESVTSLLQNVIIEPPYFLYFDNTFEGASSTQALTQPVSPANVRLVTLRLKINTKTLDQSTRTLETQAMIRSLKNQ